MRAGSTMIATAHTNGVITLEGIDANMLCLIGASVGSLPPSLKASNAVSFALKKGEQGMIAVSCCHRFKSGNAFSSERFFFFLAVKWEEGDGKPYVDLSCQWVPKDPQRIGYFFNEKLEVVIGNVVFSSAAPLGGDSKQYVNDSSLLCRYMDSKISAEQLREALRSTPESLEQKLAKAEADNQEMSKVFKNQLAEMIGETSKMSRQVEILKTEVVLYKGLALRLRDAVKKQWFTRPEVARALLAFSEVKE